MLTRSSGRTLVALAMAGTSATVASAQNAPRSLRLIGSVGAGRQVEVVADQPSHFAVFAVGKGSSGNPVQLLSQETGAPAFPSSPRKRVKARPLAPAELGRFAASEQIVLVALAADAPANLDAFLMNGRPAVDLVLSDSVVADGQRLVAALAGTVFGHNVRYTARLLPVEPQTIPLPPSVAMDHCGEAANPPSGGLAFSAAPNAGGVDTQSNGTQKSMNDGTYGAVGVVRLPGCSALVYRRMPEPTSPQRRESVPVDTPPREVSKP